MTPGRTITLVLVVAALAGACGPRHVTIEYQAELSWAERHAIESVADSAVLEARRWLPGLPPALLLKVRTGSGSEVIPETGETASAVPPATVYWTVDPQRPGGVAQVARQQLRGTLMHELHHLVRDERLRRNTLMDSVVSEGMATAFERDRTGTAPPWGLYRPAEVEAWLGELLALPPATKVRPWLFRHPDGRRWIGFKVGTFLVDRAAAASGKTPAQLVTVPTAEVLRLALGR